jgi:isopropylmalate/homocitrate/citramalate synthase
MARARFVFAKRWGGARLGLSIPTAFPILPKRWGWRVSSNHKADGGPQVVKIDREAPLIIDATLPILYPSRKEKIKGLAARWMELMKSLGVAIVRAPTDEVFVPGTVRGLEEAFFTDYQKVFRDHLKEDYAQVIFRNHDGCATGLALAWLELGGAKVVTSFGGVGSLPALEEVRMALHVSGDLPFVEAGHPLRHLKELFEYLSGQKVDDFKPVTGRGLFAQESGIHVDGLLKEPSLYEPFAPEMVGTRRYLSLGLHSGHKALLLKCDCLELPTSPSIMKGLLRKVKDKALALGRGLTDTEFEALYSTVKSHRKLPAGPKKTDAPHKSHGQTHPAKTPTPSASSNVQVTARARLLH